METLTKFVSHGELEKIFEIIDEALSEEPETQIFLDSDLQFTMYIAASSEYDNSPIRYLENEHTARYNPDQGKLEIGKWYVLRDPNTKDILMSANFIRNCLNYHQLVNFSSQRVPEYFQFVNYCKRVIFIVADTSENLALHMKNTGVEVITKNVSLKNLNSVFTIITNALEDNIDTQVFVHYKIAENLLFRNIIETPVGIISSTHQMPITGLYAKKQYANMYYKGEIWVSLYGTGELKNSIVKAASFVYDNTDYYKLVQFDKADTLNTYVHIRHGCKKLLFIDLIEEE